MASRAILQVLAMLPTLVSKTACIRQAPLLPPASTYQVATCACTGTTQPTTTASPTGTYACAPTPYYNDQNVPIDRIIKACGTDYHCVTGVLGSIANTYACDARNASSICPFASYRMAGNNYLSYEHSCCNSQNQCVSIGTLLFDHPLTSSHCPAMHPPAV